MIAQVKPTSTNNQKSGDMTKSISMDGMEFIEVDGLKIRFQRNEVGGGTAVVLTSPWPESLYAYQRVWPILSAEASLIAFDLPGFGQSEGRPQLMSPRAMGDFIPKILAALGLDRVHAIGPDVGTSALLFAANAHPDLFESLVVGSGATDAALTAGALKDFINAPSAASFEGSRGEVFATGAIDRMMKTKPDPQALKDYQASSAGRRFIEAIAYVRAYPIDLPSLRAALPDIRTPVLSIWGAHDPIVPPGNADVLDRALPRTRSLLLDSGHFVWEDRAEDYAAAILGWIRGGYRAA
jgi:pimeloyl-ACP methyl ester carboxylesterase